jgi:citronellol/citronellal dehydrogenase
VEPHPKLPGTIHTAAEAIRGAGGHALPLVCDIREEDLVTAAANETAARFGGIDILVCNASAIFLAGTEAMPMKRFDLMYQVNTRGTFLCGKACIPHLRKSDNPHILTISPPLEISEKWWGAHLAYTLAKYGMSLCVRGWAEELRPYGIAANALGPRTVIATSAVKMLSSGTSMAACRKPEIVADVVHEIVTRRSKDCTGHFFLDEAVLREADVTDFDKYARNPARNWRRTCSSIPSIPPIARTKSENGSTFCRRARTE